ncbi:hypothetical protein [Streptomyces asoensis]|uniref:Uncharacterized protein n=1 Tax=Streptomyces asoensis TaxID=249586 RepID=A0ABQ3RXF4_9ACTN|nr:hypothetical protein [Streptomyces asoensis]GGQ53174.1 hypothetical protein GCM10010496_14550 [Streptomyces asoensis]GHI60546.1 hypothetical protein Saso_21960 [Streptomyces asoensis]
MSLKVRADVRVEVHGLRLGGVRDEGPSESGGPTVRIDAWGPVGGVSVQRAQHRRPITGGLSGRGRARSR